jgi:hypothetical protein
MVDAIQEVEDGIDVYYVTAGFGAGSTAVADNAVAKRELYVDVDCGPSKPYADKAEGAKALKTFCKSTGLPQPTVVDSGNGLHAHWIFEEAVPVHEWQQVAQRLKALCKEKQFHADAACTADVVRVLRVPETINYKNNSMVQLLNGIRHYDFKALKTAIGQTVILAKDTFAKAKALSGSGSGLTKSLAAGDPNRISKFETIWINSVRGDGCAQIKNAIERVDTLPEPVWRAVLSVAQHCDDRDWAIHEVSKDHPNYTPEETEQKAANTKGPYTCETFQGLETGALCAGCQHAGKITSPIQLGTTVKVIPSTEKVIKEYGGRKFEIPSFPQPYFRGDRGGVYMRKPKNGDDDKEEFDLVYPYDLYVYKRMREADLGDVVWMRHHLPNDAVRDFMVSQKEVGALDKMRDKLNEQGVAVFSPGQLTKLQAYIGKSIQDMQMHTRADEMYSRFGWTRDNTFIIGDREYTKKGVIHAPVVRGIEKFVSAFTPKGSLEEWKSIINIYNASEFDRHAFGVLAGFGSILMNLSPENGGVVNFFSKKSGTGKTTILRAVNSIFGDPKALMKDAQDTHLTKVHRMGLMNGMPVTLDEMTNTKPEDLSSMLYGSTQGRARDRMKAGENAERTNDLTWKMISVWSSNSSIEDRLGMIKSDPQGEMARVIEIHLQTPVPSDVLEIQKKFNALAHNYGHAGHVFLNHVIPNLEECLQIWEETRDVVYSKRNWTQTERYRLNTAICAFAAGVITNNLKLTSYNLGRIAKTVIDDITRAGEDLRAQSTTARETFAAFVNKNINNMLVIDSKKRSNGLQNEPYIKPKGMLSVRYEPDTKMLFVVQRDFNRWCAENFINAKEMRTLFQDETGRSLELIKKRMGAGWDADFGAVYAYCITDAMTTLGLEEDDMGISKD